MQLWVWSCVMVPSPSHAAGRHGSSNMAALMLPGDKLSWLSQHDAIRSRPPAQRGALTPSVLCIPLCPGELLPVWVVTVDLIWLTEYKNFSSIQWTITLSPTNSESSSWEVPPSRFDFPREFSISPRVSCGISLHLIVSLLSLFSDFYIKILYILLQFLSHVWIWFEAVGKKIGACCRGFKHYVLWGKSWFEWSLLISSQIKLLSLPF